MRKVSFALAGLALLGLISAVALQAFHMNQYAIGREQAPFSTLYLVVALAQLPLGLAALAIGRVANLQRRELLLVSIPVWLAVAYCFLAPQFATYA